MIFLVGCYDIVMMKKTHMKLVAQEHAQHSIVVKAVSVEFKSLCNWFW